MQLITISNSMELYYTCKNVAFVTAVIFAILSIVYGMRVHILVTFQKYLGIEKRREIARMGKRESGKLRENLRAVTAEHEQIRKVLQNENGLETVVLPAVKTSEETVVLQEEPKLVMKKTIMEVNGEDIV